ncbi:MAG: prenyltransferase [Sinobacteraceae bacterium]|nr:prenyltransferase [Nevskiaceae bacterium]
MFGNEVFDYASDRSNRAAGPFNGGSRILVDGKLSFGQLRDGIALGVAAALVCAIFAVMLTPQPATAAALLAVSFVITLGYTVPPLKLCWRGLGELDVAVSHSFMVLLLGYVLQGGAWQAPLPWLLAAPLCIAVLPAIILSGLPDRHADAAAGKRTLPVRLGARKAAWLALALALAAAVAVIVVAHLPATQKVYRGIVWGVVPNAAILAFMLLRLLHRHPDPADQRIDSVLVVALVYILWFVVVPFRNLI